MASEGEALSRAEALVQALSNCLTEQQPESQLKRAPAGLDRAIESFGSSNNTSRVFQTKGFWAWLAYFLATSQHTDIERNLSELSVSALQYVATEISKFRADSSLVTRIEHTFYVSNRAAKRRKHFQENHIVLPAPSSSFVSEPPFCSPQLNVPSSPLESSPCSPSPDPNPSKRPRLEPIQQNLDRQIDTTRDATSNIMHRDILQQGGVSDIGLARHNGISELPTFKPTSSYECAFPEAKNLPFVFPPDLCTTIVKRDGQASLMISLPPDPRDCRLVLDISAEDVQYLASDLFGVRIRVCGQQRTVVLDNGTTMVILCTMKLEDARAPIWNKTLGDMVAEGVRNSPMRLDEASNGAMLSKCLSLEIPGTANCPARLCLMVQPDRLSSIYQHLWRS